MKPLALAVLALSVSPLFAQSVDEVPQQGPDLKDIKVEKHRASPKTAEQQAAAGKAAAASSLQQCDLQQEAFGYKLKRQVDSATGFAVFLTKDVGNAFQVCLNRTQSVFFQGAPIWGSIRTDASNLIVEAVMGKRGMIPADDVVNGHVAGEQYMVPGRPSYELSSRSMHYIELAKLTPEAINAGGNNTVYGDRVGWVSLLIDPRTREARVMQVRLSDADPQKAAAAIKKAFALGTASKSAFGDAKSIDQIVAYVKKELPRHEGKGKPMIKSPMVEINLFVRKDSGVYEPATVATILARGTKAGLDSRGEDIVNAEDYDSLLFCYQNAALETRQAHNQHLRK